MTARIHPELLRRLSVQVGQAREDRARGVAAAHEFSASLGCIGATVDTRTGIIAIYEPRGSTMAFVREELWDVFRIAEAGRRDA